MQKMQEFAMADQDYKKALGGRIKTIRKERNLSQKDLAQRLGIRYQKLNKYEGGFNLPTADLLTRFAVELDVSLDRLLTGSDNGQPVANARLLERVRALEGIPATDIEAVITLIDGVLAKNTVENAAQRFVKNRAS